MLNPSMGQLISLRGKGAMITGAASGIGKAIARRFAEAGAFLHLVDINPTKLKEIKTELSQYGNPIHTHTIDLADKNSIIELWASCTDSEPEILVNNAGIYPTQSMVEVDDAFYRRVMAVNLDSVFWMCQEMIKRRFKRGGVIINVSSIEALVPFKSDLVHYGMSKAGVIALTRGLAREYARHGFRINTLVPGGVITEGTRSVARELFQMKFGLLKVAYDFHQRLPIGRPGQPDEVARIALVLATDLASYMHGSVIVVDGGFMSA